MFPPLILCLRCCSSKYCVMKLRRSSFKDLNLEQFPSLERIPILEASSLSQKDKNCLPEFYRYHNLTPTLQELEILYNACNSIPALQTLQDYIATYYEVDCSDDTQIKDLNHKIDHKILDIQAPSVYKTMLWDIFSLAAFILVILMICLK